MWTIDAFDDAVHQHDATIAAAGQAIWVGSEPTFTDRGAQTPEWLNTALGGDKEARAQALLAGLCARQPGALVLRSVGRQYPGEARPRWNLGLYHRRDGTPLWQGPPDPLLGAPEGGAGFDLARWADALASALLAQGWPVWPVPGGDPGERRLLMRAADARPADPPDASDERLRRPSVHARAIPAGGLRDALAESGLHLWLLGTAATDGPPVARVELPQFGTLPLFMAALRALEAASLACGLPALIVAGYTPPVDASIALTTVTPDPAVIEVNTAPSVDAAGFLRRSREIYAAAAEQGLAPYRLYFNGTVADSGGGGQITLGGPSPQASPFVLTPQLLPRLVRYVNRHPALSYLFSHDFVGGSGQSVRPDERGADAFDELVLALELLQREPAVSPERLWHSLAPFLCDTVGNSHRAEINIEKLWNPFLAERGRLGLVEFRALRMQHTPERATALACLLRSVVAMLARTDPAAPLIDWGRELHERFALPFYLEQDLRAVLADLAAAGLALGDPITAVLWREDFRRWGQVSLPGGTLEIRRALEFWPLLGDAASPEQGGGSRLVDASTARVELRWRPAPDADPQAWQIVAGGIALPMRHERDGPGNVQVFGLRYRSFVPHWGLHPALAAQSPLHLWLRQADQAVDHRVTLHEWHPEGGAYAGLPADLAAARTRRAERVTLATLPRRADTRLRPPPTRGLGRYCLDLRCLPA